VNQTIQAIWFTSPDMQLVIFLIYGRVLSELICRYVGLMSSAIWFIIGHRLCAAFVLGYRKITNLCHNLLCSAVIPVIVHRNARSMKMPIFGNTKNIVLVISMKKNATKIKSGTLRLFAQPGVLLFGNLLALPVPELRTIRPNLGRTIASVQPTAPISPCGIFP
jgi:hypothetical protein